MKPSAYPSFSSWYAEGQQASFVRAPTSPGGVLDRLAAARLAGDMSRPALRDSVLYQDMLGCSRVRGDIRGTLLREEKPCDLLERTDVPVTELASEVGYSSNEVLARVFLKHRRMDPLDYRQAVRHAVCTSISHRAFTGLEGRQ